MKYGYRCGWRLVQAFAGVLAYNLAENNAKIKFDYSSDSFQNSQVSTTRL